MAAARDGFALPENRHTFLNTREPPRERRGCAVRSRRDTQSQRRAAKETRRSAARASPPPRRSVRHGHALVLGAAFSLGDALVVAAPGVLHVALLLVGGAQDEPRLGVRRVE